MANILAQSFNAIAIERRRANDIRLQFRIRLLFHQQLQTFSAEPCTNSICYQAYALAYGLYKRS